MKECTQYAMVLLGFCIMSYLVAVFVTRWEYRRSPYNAPMPITGPPERIEINANTVTDLVHRVPHVLIYQCPVHGRTPDVREIAGDVYCYHCLYEFLVKGGRSKPIW